MANNKSKYFLYRHRDSEITTIGDFISDLSSIGYGFTASQLLGYKDENDEQNIIKVFSLYDNEEKNTYSNEFDFSVNPQLFTDTQLEKLPLKLNTVLALDLKVINNDMLGVEGNQVVDYQSYSGFLASQLYVLLKDKKYERITQMHKKSLGVIKEIYNSVSVWCWCRSLSTEGKNVIINVSPFVNSLTTNVTGQGGTFSLSLAPILCEFDGSNWKIKDTSIKFTPGNFVSDAIPTFSDKEDKLRFETFYFNTVIQQNDVFFIRFEKLGVDKDRDSLVFEIDQSELPNKVYDMIGLVDNNVISYEPESNDVSISISGRDLIKLFIEDGVYLYSTGFANGGIFSNLTDKENLLRYDGQLLTLFQYSLKSLDSILKFIVNALGNISIVDDELFSAYRSSKDLDGRFRDRRSYSYFIADASIEQQDNFNKGIEANQQFAIDSIKESRLQDGLNKSDEELELKECLQIFSDLQDFFKAADEADVLSGVSWGAFIYKNQNLKKGGVPKEFVNRLYSSSSQFFRPTDSSDFENLIPIKSSNAFDGAGSYYVLSRDFAKFQLKREQKPLKGIWQIFKLVIDESISKRRLADSSIGNENGSLINAIKKVCQEPWVEFFTDTYGDQFYAVVRKPPFDKQGYTDLMKGTTVIEKRPIFDQRDVNGVPIPSETDEVIINEQNVDTLIRIQSEDLLNVSLDYTTECYSWYRLVPQNLLAGSDNEMAFAYLKAVYFKEYADIFGSKPLDIVSNYIDFYPLKDKNENLNVAYFIQQGMRDLKFMIDSHAYLPFVRQGTITINGDRRIKKGTLVHLEFTNEICYVDSVQNNFSVSENGVIDRTTVLNVSRCMVKDFVEGKQISLSEIYGGSPSQRNLDGKPVDNILVSYFNIINTPIDDSVFINPDLTQADFNTIISGTWSLNKPVFDFFIKRMQFRK